MKSEGAGLRDLLMTQGTGVIVRQGVRRRRKPRKLRQTRVGEK